MHYRTLILSLILANSLVAAPTSYTDDDEEEAICLEPFIIEVDPCFFELDPCSYIEEPDDQSYIATDCLAGIRIRTDLKNISTCISVVIEEFLRDLENVSNESLLAYKTSPNLTLPLSSLYDDSFDAFLPKRASTFRTCGFSPRTKADRNYERILSKLYNVTLPTLYTLPTWEQLQADFPKATTPNLLPAPSYTDSPKSQFLPSPNPNYNLFVLDLTSPLFTRPDPQGRSLAINLLSQLAPADWLAVFVPNTPDFSLIQCTPDNLDHLRELLTQPSIDFSLVRELATDA